MSRFGFASVLPFAFSAAAFTACSFYTDCPCANQPPAQNQGGTAGTPALTGGTTGSGGSSGTGTGATGAEGGAGGETTETIPEWHHATGNLAGKNVACGSVMLVSVKPDDNRLIAGLSEAGLWASDDGGETWSALGTSGKSAAIVNRATSIIYDPDHPKTFWETGIYATQGGVYRTDDAGETFIQLGTIWHNELMSVDFADPKRKTLLAGGHEQAQTLYRSTDGGDTWDAIGDKLPTTCKASSYPVLLDPQTYLLGCVNGILRTTDGGDTWDEVSSSGGAAPPLLASDGTIYWPADGGALMTSTDQGETWNRVLGGGVLFPVQPIELPDGRIAGLGQKRVLVSDDGGSSWTPVSADLPFTTPSGFVYSAGDRAFYTWAIDCNMVIDPGAIQRSTFDYEKQ